MLVGRALEWPYLCFTMQGRDLGDEVRRALLFLWRRDLWTEHKGSRHPGLWRTLVVSWLNSCLQITALPWETDSLQAWKGHHEVSVYRTARIVTFLRNNLERSGSLCIAGSESQHLECYCRGSPGTVPGQCVWDLSWTKWHWYRILSLFFCFLLLVIILPVFSIHIHLRIFVVNSRSKSCSWFLRLFCGRKAGCLIFRRVRRLTKREFKPLKPELNPICYLLALLGAHHFLHVSRIRVKSLTLRLLMSYIYIYIYGAPILDVSRSHTTTHHSR